MNLERLSPFHRLALDDADRVRLREIDAWRQRVFDEKPDSELRLRRASMSATAGQQVYLLLKSLAPARILEIGTCAGIGAAYMIAGALRGQELGEGRRVHFTGTEGIDAKRRIAEETLQTLFGDELDWSVAPGMFDETLPRTIAQARPLEFVYLDAQHDEHHTVRNFEWAASAMGEGGVIMVDDLGNDSGMRAAGKRIRSNPRIAAVHKVKNKEVFRLR